MRAELLLLPHIEGAVMGAFERNILQVIVLMLENRSFDHMLGFLKTPNGLTGNESNDGVVVSNDAAR